VVYLVIYDSFWARRGIPSIDTTHDPQKQGWGFISPRDVNTGLGGPFSSGLCRCGNAYMSYSLGTDLAAVASCSTRCRHRVEWQHLMRCK